jgi:hypothetical protein
MSNKLTRYKQVEDWLCDYIDSSFNDTILCDKEFSTDVTDCRAIYISQVKEGFDDQSATAKYEVSFKSTRKTRVQAISDISILNEIFPIYNVRVENGLVISVNMDYIATPIRIMVDSKQAYFLSATFTLTTT